MTDGNGAPYDEEKKQMFDKSPSSNFVNVGPGSLTILFNFESQKGAVEATGITFKSTGVKEVQITFVEDSSSDTQVGRS